MTTRTVTSHRVILIRGENEALVAQRAHAVITELLGDLEPSLVVEEHGGAAIEDLDVGTVIDAMSTPPFLVDRRIIVVRDVGSLKKADVKRLTDVLGDETPGIHLVLVADGRGALDTGLVKAVGAAGQVIDVSVRAGKVRTSWIGEHIAGAKVKFTPGAARRIGTHLGEDLGRLESLLGSLTAAYGPGATITEEALEPFLGKAGSVPPWDLTDAIDAGNVGLAVATLRRMIAGGARNESDAVLFTLSILHRHFSGMLRLDGATLHTGEDAAGYLGLSSGFQGKKLLDQTNRLGGERISEAIIMLSDADIAVKGGSALPSGVTAEILVARLAQLSRRRPSSSRHSRRR